jgi:hypothetical protein
MCTKSWNQCSENCIFWCSVYDILVHYCTLTLPWIVLVVLYYSISGTAVYKS